MAITTGMYKPLVDVKAATRKELLPVLKRKIKSKAIMGVAGRMPAPEEAKEEEVADDAEEVKQAKIDAEINVEDYIWKKPEDRTELEKLFSDYPEIPAILEGK
jgi:hypothetical protein